MIRNAECLLSFVELSNSLWKKGYLETATMIERLIEDQFGPLPYVREAYQYLDLAGRISIDAPPLIGWCRPQVSESAVNRGRIKARFSPNLHRIEYRSWVISPKFKTYEVDGWRECLRVLNTGSTRSELGVYALPHRIRLRRGWAAA